MFSVPCRLIPPWKNTIVTSYCRCFPFVQLWHSRLFLDELLQGALETFRDVGIVQISGNIEMGVWKRGRCWWLLQNLQWKGFRVCSGALMPFFLFFHRIRVRHASPSSQTYRRVIYTKNISCLGKSLCVSSKLTVA